MLTFKPYNVWVARQQPYVDLDRRICNDSVASQQREWLVTNGIGGYAMGTVAGVRTRSYHGLLIAAIKPPLGRRQLLANLEETAVYGNDSFELFSNHWQSGQILPEGYLHIERFYLDGTTPVWIYAVGSARLEKRLWMQPGANTTYVKYTLLYGTMPLGLSIKTLVNYRDHHAINLDASIQMGVEQLNNGLRINTPSGGSPFYILSDKANVQTQHVWYENFFLSFEADRGLASLDNSLFAGKFHAELQPGESVLVAASTDSAVELDSQKAYLQRAQYETSLVSASGLDTAPDAVQQLVLAADQFIVKRGGPEDADGKSVIAGYPWFSDWGRDTMISLPGLTLETGRPDVAAKILRTYAKFFDQGMLPNRFPDAGETPEYNTVDATLWYFQAIRSYFKLTQDDALLRELYPILEDSISWHTNGTRHNIHVDPTDHLLYAGEKGTQLTWMDAKFGDWVVTPRIGKPVEINALWYNALCIMAEFAQVLGIDQQTASYNQRAEQVAKSFNRFWNEAGGYCFDVIDGPEGNEERLRPNQLIAVSLPHSPLGRAQQWHVVDVCERSLLTPFGLRSLTPVDPGFKGWYEGNTEQRDSAYHQGTVWAWLIGPFVQAHLRVYDNNLRARQFLEPLLEAHLKDSGLGSVSEIFDGSLPFTARGCPWQAWSVAELLRAWKLTQ